MERERGQATPLLAMIVLLAAMLGLGLARMGAHLVDRAAARTAADAAALAAAADGRVAAVAVAEANGAQLLSYAESGGDVVVTVDLDGETARARATAEPD